MATPSTEREGEGSRGQAAVKEADRLPSAVWAYVERRNKKYCLKCCRAETKAKIGAFIEKHFLTCSALKRKFNVAYELFAKTPGSDVSKAPVAHQQLGRLLGPLTPLVVDRTAAVDKKRSTFQGTREEFFTEMREDRKCKLTDIHSAALLHEGLSFSSHSFT